IPAAAEPGQSLALRLPGLGVLDEVVERMSPVGDLDLAVAAAGRAEKRRIRSVSSDRPAAGHERRPVLCAVALAGGPCAFVVSPQIQRLAVGVAEDAPEIARSDLDDPPARDRA